MSSTLVTTDPTSTTNITGFFISVRGFSFTNESFTAPPAIPQFHRDFFLFFAERPGIGGSGIVVIGILTLSCSVDRVVMMASKNLSGMHQQVLEDRAQAERREKCKCADDQDHGNQQKTEKRSCHWKRSRGYRHE